MRSPASAKAAIVRGVLESVMLELDELPQDDETLPLRSSVAAALAATTALEESALADGDHFERLERAVQALGYATSIATDTGAAGGSLSKRIAGVDTTLQEVRSQTIDALVSVQGSVPPPASREEAAATAFRGSAGDKPLVQLLNRPPLRVDPLIGPLDEEIAEEGGGDALEDRPDEFQVVHRLQVLGQGNTSKPELDISAVGEAGERALVQRLMRDCLEEMGSLAMLMQHEDGEVFDQDAQAERERRLTRDLDALLALGEPFTTLHGDVVRIDVVGETLRYARDTLAYDPRRAFAHAFVLSSVAGSDAVHAAVFGARQSAPGVYNVLAQALSLAVNPKVPGALVELLREDGDPELVATTLDVLHAHRKSAFATTQVLLQHAKPEIRMRAARNLAYCELRDAALAALSSVPNHELDDEVRSAALHSLFALDLEKGREVLRQDLEDIDSWAMGTRDKLMCLLGIAGTARDAQELQRLHGAAEPSSEYADAALGFHGHVSHVETLIANLNSSTYRHRGDRKRAVANALIRITGAPLQVKATAEHYDFYQPIIDEDTWRAWWDENKERFDPEVRYRFGQPFHGLTVVSELERNRMPYITRKLCALELSLVTGADAVVLQRWVTEQRAAVASARAGIEAEESHAPGTWLSHH